jgi:hypothetical protein
MDSNGYWPNLQHTLFSSFRRSRLYALCAAQRSVVRMLLAVKLFAAKAAPTNATAQKLDIIH